MATAALTVALPGMSIRATSVKNFRTIYKVLLKFSFKKKTVTQRDETSDGRFPGRMLWPMDEVQKILERAEAFQSLVDHKVHQWHEPSCSIPDRIVVLPLHVRGKKVEIMEINAIPFIINLHLS